MPSTTELFGGLVLAALVLVGVIALLLKRKSSPTTAVVAPPPQAHSGHPAALAKSSSAPAAVSLPPPSHAEPLARPATEPMATVVKPRPAPPSEPPGAEFPLPAVSHPIEEHEAPLASMPPEVIDDAVVEVAPDVDAADEVELAAPQETPTTPPPHSDESSRSSRAPRPAMRSYSNISDESVAEEVRRSHTPPAAFDVEPVEAKAPPASAKPMPRPVAPTPTFSRPEPAPTPSAAPKPPAPKPFAADPKPFAPPAPKSEPKVAGPAPVAAKAAVSTPPTQDHDFSALNNDSAAAKAKPAAATAARFLPPSNPATAELEKNDPRHAAARRLARLSVSEIKLYHEAEVTAGREAKDLWKRLITDIGLATQTFEKRVDKEVRERFDYLYDEILRQLAEGDVTKLGPDAPAAKAQATAPATVEATPASSDDTDYEAPTATARRTLEPVAPVEAKSSPSPVVEPAKPAPAVVAPAPAPVAAPAAAAPAAAAAKPTGLAARMVASNPETAELEKSDPRHAAARRLARLSVSEIKLYHEDEVKAGREAKDLWKRMITDIGLATQTFDKRVDKEVRERFDYLYDEILRQLAEGDVAKLGPEAPKPKGAPQAAAAPVEAAAPSSSPEISAPAPKPAPSQPSLAPKPVPKPAPSEPSLAPKAAPAKTAPSEPQIAAPKPATAPAPTATAAVSPAARFLPPSNPATAELEKSDPRHAAARRLARLSVSEIKLYHEDEVKAGREAKDLWKRLITDIGLATQTYEKRVDKEVRERFDYLYDEILRQLAEGDIGKLGADAPKPKVDA